MQLEAILSQKQPNNERSPLVNVNTDLHWRPFVMTTKPVAEGGLGGPCPPHGENFCMEVRGDPYEKGLFWGIWGLAPPHGDLPATGLVTTSGKLSWTGQK